MDTDWPDDDSNLLDWPFEAWAGRERPKHLSLLTMRRFRRHSAFVRSADFGSNDIQTDTIRSPSERLSVGADLTMGHCNGVYSIELFAGVSRVFHARCRGKRRENLRRRSTNGYYCFRSDDASCC